MKGCELSNEIEKLKVEFVDADERKLKVLDALIEQAACETIYLKRLNKQALKTGLVQIHPNDINLQRALPVSGEIAKHSATLTNIMDKLCKWLCVESEEEDDELKDYE